MTSSRKSRARTYHHGDLRAAVLRTTVAVIEERGGIDFSMREIADQAGVTHPALYKHFADKRALLVQIAIEGYGLLDAAITSQVDMSAGRAAIASDAAAAYIAFALDQPAHFRIMFGPRLNRDEQYPELEKAVQASYARLYQAMGGTGSIMSSEQRKVHDRSFALWSMIHGYAMLLLDDRIIGLRADKRRADAQAYVRRLIAPLAASFEA